MLERLLGPFTIDVMDERVFVTVLLLLILDLVISGVVGLVRKETRMKNQALRVLLFPLVILPWLIELLFGQKEKETGEAAVIASVSSLAFAFLLLVVLGAWFASESGAVPDWVLNVTVPLLLIPLIVGMICFIAAQSAKKRSE
ncbi:hypothetical protein JXA12_05160 [Candidatus Woesearchaeota archaeon]|nr:hypothetical protein [Candidatus Woesearchaeota archaeon]